MLLAYIDDIAAEGMVGLAGYVLPAENARSLQDALEAIVQSGMACTREEQTHLSDPRETWERPRTWRRYGMNFIQASGSAELHGTEIFGGKNEWRSVPVPRRIEMYRQCLALLDAHDALVFVRAGHPPPGVARKHALRTATWMTLAVVEELASMKSTTALVFCDEQSVDLGMADGIIDSRRKSDMKYFRSADRVRIVDAVHAVKSSRSRLIQLADLVAYCWCRQETTLNDFWKSIKALEYHPIRMVYGEQSK